jgi:hypothetical protein
MSNERVTARDVFAIVIAEATGRSRSEVYAILDCLPMRGLDREYTRAEAEEWLAELRGELPAIRAWLLAGAGRLEARLAAARIDAANWNGS